MYDIIKIGVYYNYKVIGYTPFLLTLEVGVETGDN
ncbi:hypothetical protein [Bacillus phage PK16]|nr:hypothetical protein [Bacillus phage PK16]